MIQPALDPTHLSRLRWQCRRGMRELDVVLLRYLERIYPTVGAGDRLTFEALLEQQDPVILSYLTGAATPDDQAMTDVVQQLTRTYA